MPELPDVTVYIRALEARVSGTRFEKARLKSPFLLRSVDPPLSDFEGRTVRDVRRLGKRIVLEFDGAYFLVLHLMIAGRLRWRPGGGKPPGRIGLAAFDFSNGSLILTEAGTKRRAALHAVRGEASLAEHDPGGLEVLDCRFEEFAAALRLENHTLKRALTDPRLFSGIGNSYSDEILHAARLSPVQLTQNLPDDAIRDLFDATRHTLETWTRRLLDETGQGFPTKVTAFREGMAVHGRYREACPVCTSPVQRIVYAEHETNYCAPCQTGGKLLADRALSRLLKKDWPRRIEELEALRRRRV